MWQRLPVVAGRDNSWLPGKSTLCNYTHHEPVQRVCWTKDPLHRGHRGYLLCSIAADGKVRTCSLLTPNP